MNHNVNFQATIRARIQAPLARRWCRGGVASASAVLVFALLGGCASLMNGYGVGAQAEHQAEIQQANREPAPDSPTVYLDLISRMQAEGLYYASLAHIDAFEKQYGTRPDTILMRGDALRMTDQPAAAADAYTKLLQTPLAARGYRGLGLIAGAAGDFSGAAQQLQEAARLAPTDPSTLSDLGYAELRAGNLDAARVPLMKAAQLDQTNQKIASNVALYLLANGDDKHATLLMDQQKFTPDVRAAIHRDALKVDAASRAQQRAAQAQMEQAAQVAQASQQTQQAQQDARAAPMASAQGLGPAPRLLQRFSQ